jgi:hypothetical protein
LKPGERGRQEDWEKLMGSDWERGRQEDWEKLMGKYEEKQLEKC